MSCIHTQTIHHVLVQIRYTMLLLTCMYAALYRSIPGKHPLPGKHPCSAFQGVNVAASIQMYIYGSYIAHVGQNHKLCLSTRGRLPGTLRYIHTNMQSTPHSYSYLR